ncbi:hypothetical protein C1645_825112 [Glomus cerebriforme]|uniref:Uncharacterized protein n=1 Tax=Glomus cerebriforme TaxID=658196 RepID=A0A397SW67_9GLOM|nr:hypothetical protein C1645_825112 [Glomus cerebriforme]
MLNIPTKYIELWKINFSLVNVNEEIINNCANININIQDTLGDTELSGRLRISNEFPTQPNINKLESSKYKEKEVDTDDIMVHITKILYTERRPEMIILLARDMSKYLKNIDLPKFSSLKTIIINLDPLYKKFTSAYSLANTLEKKFLKISDEYDIKYDDKDIKTCMKEKCSQAQEIKKVIDKLHTAVNTANKTLLIEAEDVKKEATTTFQKIFRKHLHKFNILSDEWADIYHLIDAINDDIYSFLTVQPDFDEWLKVPPNWTQLQASPK